MTEVIENMPVVNLIGMTDIEWAALQLMMLAGAPVKGEPKSCNVSTAGTTIEEEDESYIFA